jgi:parvulin-like peptidyl-prolyl isomerase
MKVGTTLLTLILAAAVPMPAQLTASHASTQAAKQPSASVQPAGKPVARVNGVVLTEHDLLREEYTIFPYARQHNGQIPRELEPDIRKGALQMIIFDELVYQEALRRKLTVSPAKLQQAEADFRTQFHDPEQYRQLLQIEFQGSEQLLRKKIRRSLLIDALLKTEVENKSVVSLAELKSYYDGNPKAFEYPESFAIQTISVIPPQNATPQQMKEARKRVEEALRQAKAARTYEEFGILAEKISEDDYRVMMGDHKAVERGKMAPQLVQALLSMQPGQVSDIIQVDQIYTIVRLNKHIPAGKKKFEDVRSEIKNELEKRKTNQVRGAFAKKLRQNAKIEIL